MNDFATVNGIYAKFFGKHAPARSAVEVARLPKDVLVEIECIARCVASLENCSCTYSRVQLKFKCISNGLEDKTKVP